MIHNLYDNEANVTKYNNYNFSDAKYWNDFWFSEYTNVLLDTIDYTIGKNEVQIATIRLIPSRFIEKAQEVKASALGIPYSFGDKIVANITFKHNLNIDVYGKVPIHEGSYFKSSDVIVMMDHDFTEREFIIRYYGYADILGKIGGLTASFRPLLEAAAPIFILFYLFTLSEIILNKNKLKF
jgi:hypothetical protein